MLVIKAVYQLCNLQNLAARKLMLGSGAVCIDLPSQVNCAMHCLKEVHVHVLACVLCCVTRTQELVETFKSFFRAFPERKDFMILKALKISPETAFVKV